MMKKNIKPKKNEESVCCDEGTMSCESCSFENSIKVEEEEE